MEKVNYMQEIRKIEAALESLETIEDARTDKSGKGIKSRLGAMLSSLKETTDQMASYIRGDWGNEDIIRLKQINTFNTSNKDYLTGLTKILHMERIMLICTTQTIEEKQAFLHDYAKYCEEKEKIITLKKVR